MTQTNLRNGPDANGLFGAFGGRYVAETLMPLILDLAREYEAAKDCLLYTSPSPRDRQKSRMPSSA